MLIILALESAAIIALAVLWWNRRVHVKDCHAAIRNLSAKLAKVHQQRLEALGKARLVKLSQTAEHRARLAETTALMRQELGLRLVVSND